MAGWVDSSPAVCHKTVCQSFLLRYGVLHLGNCRYLYSNDDTRVHVHINPLRTCSHARTLVLTRTHARTHTHARTLTFQCVDY